MIPVEKVSTTDSAIATYKFPADPYIGADVLMCDIFEDTILLMQRDGNKTDYITLRYQHIETLLHLIRKS